MKHDWGTGDSAEECQPNSSDDLKDYWNVPFFER